MNTIDFVANIISVLGIVFLVWNSVRANFLHAEFDGKHFDVPKDEVKESFRRAALAEASRIAGGRRVNLSLCWKGNKLIIKSEDN